MSGAINPPKMTARPSNSFIKKLKNDIDVNNLDIGTKKLIAANIMGDRHGCLIQKIIHKKMSENNNIVLPPS